MIDDYFTGSRERVYIHVLEMLPKYFQHGEGILKQVQLVKAVSGTSLMRLQPAQGSASAIKFGRSGLDGLMQCTVSLDYNGGGVDPKTRWEMGSRRRWKWGRKMASSRRLCT